MKLVTTPLVWTVFFVVIGVILALNVPWPLLPGWLPWALIAGAVVWTAWRVQRTPRVFRRWGYAERNEDVYLTSGLWSRQLQCVPYGRMQVVEVEAGPIDRLFKLANVKMVTSSTSGTVYIPGLAPEDAAALRDRLVSKGELQQAGI